MSSGTWMNGDGLFVEFGTTKVAIDPVGEYKTYGDFREVNVRIPDMTVLTSSAAIISNNFKFPIGERIARVDVITDVACTGAGATFDLGLQKDDRSTELDYNGLVAALPLASIDAVGETTSLTAGSTYAGVLLGTSTTDVGAYLTANYNTAAFTAGALNIRIFLYGRGTITQ